MNGWHAYKVAWTSTGFDYFVDGTKVGTIDWAASGGLGPFFVDQSNDGSALLVDNVSVGPVNATGSVTSRVLDAGKTVSWS